ncbi:MAG: putative NTP pyrophosphohydrolase [uncultured marine phage]|uniref:Putative NTP pyrophosphohydrolase n=1 Tax=uncultured marine phage TaxID=707152 RepID=A0A8D9CCB9_9VIRU|nr:MAG: putative NTP pyrophosphohydrolase [uncultured marine phage]
MDSIKLVKEFHDAFDHPVTEPGSDVDLQYRQLRIKLLFEELQELSEASDVRETFENLCWENITKNEHGDVQMPKHKDGNNVDKVEELDALADIQYVLSGAILTLGHYPYFNEAFKDVHDSNMTKLCENMGEVNDTIEYYVNERGMSKEDITYVPNGDKFMINRKSDLKVLKNVHYQAVDLKKYV